MTLTVITPAGEDLVSMEALRLQLGLQGIADWDTLLLGYRAAAVELLEAATQRRFLTQVLEWSLPGWPCAFELPVAPVRADGVISIVYVDASGADVTLPPDRYVVSPTAHTVEIRPRSGAPWPVTSPDAAEAVRVRFTVGNPVEAVSMNVVVAAQMLVALMYRHRGDDAPPVLAPSNLPIPVESLIGGERW